MNTNEYIESGILEAYALGALSPEERLQVESNIAQYPELAAELKVIEDTMLSLTNAGAVEPPAYLKEHIWDAIVGENTSILHSEKPAYKEDAPNVHPFTPEVHQPKWQRAAIWAAFLVSAITNFVLLSQRNKLKEDQVAMQQQMDTVLQQQKYLSQTVAAYTKEKEMLADTLMQAIVMKTMQPGHPMAATIYWSKTNGDAYLAVQKLPPPPTGKQYQMWVIQDGKPVSMGIIANNIITDNSITKFPMHVTSSQAFAISLENEGGVASPTMVQIQVLGKPS